MKKQTIEQLCQRYADGIASAAEVEQLNSRLRNDEQARQKFLELLNLDSSLATLVAELPSTGLPEQKIRGGVSRFSFSRRSVAWLISVAACIALIVGAQWLLPTSGFASVTSSQGAGKLEIGKQLFGEWHEVSAGSIALLTRNHASLVVEAPAKFRFESAQRLHLVHGRLSAEVPPSAKKFTVITPTGNVVDLGTRFGVDVPLQGNAEVHVFQGEVVAQSIGTTQSHNLFVGNAMRLEEGAGSTCELRSNAFIGPQEVRSLHAAIAAGRQKVSDAALDQLRQDPALILLLDFESSNPSEPLEGQFQMVQGRWPGTHAPEFVNGNDHIKIDISGDKPWKQVTLGTWVRLDQVTEPYQSLLHADGWGAEGVLHWMVTKEKILRVGICKNVKEGIPIEIGHEADSLPSPIFDEVRWIHLATVYDAEKQVARHYLNGKFNTEVPYIVAHPALMGQTRIGNWDWYDRRLSGRIDELVILGRAMSSEEIQTLYDAGNPYR